MVKIRKALSSNKNHYGGKNGKLYLTIHTTGNTNKGANAENHRKFINNGSSETWHYTVDSIEAVQHFDHAIQCWHAGDGKGNGNLNSIGIEMCVNSDGDYKKTVQNTADLVQKLMKDLNIPLKNVVQHNKWSGKDCPKELRKGKDGITWDDFKNMISKTPAKKETVKKDTAKASDTLYKVQAGAFSKKDGAEALAKKLKKDGYDVIVVKQ